MTKFSELSSDQKDAIQGLLQIGMERKITEEIEYTNQIYRLLILGNGAGIALLATFMGAIAASGNPISELVSPIWKFLSGAVFGALIYVPLMAVASQATTHYADQAANFYQNKLDLEQMHGWGLTARGRKLLLTLMLLSFGMFLWGIVQCIYILSNQ